MNRVNTIITFLATIFCLSATAQKGPSFIGVSGGLSFPTGNWGKAAFISSTNGYASDPAGFADKGGFAEINGAWFFSKHFGVGGLFRYGTYKTKGLDVLSAGYQDSFDVDQVETSANSWKVWSLMPGIYYDQAFAKKFSFTARALAGITHATTPTISVGVTDSDIDDGTFTQQPASKTAFGFDGGIGLSYRVWKGLAVRLQGDYFYSKPDLTIQNSERQNAAGRLADSYNQALAGFNVSLGVAYVLGK
jgi:opacity protein-like surface antigen